MALIDDVQLARLHNNPSTFKNFSFLQSFTRPADAIAYSVGDAINNSTSAPVALSQDLASQGVPVGAVLEITDTMVVVNNATQLENMAVCISGVPLTLANDNAAFALTLAQVQSGQVSFIPVSGGVSTSRPMTNATMVENDFTYTTIPLTGTTLYVTLLANAARTPVSGEVYTVGIFGRIL